MDNLTELKEGTTLFDVFALDKPELLGGTEQAIAQIILESDMITSNWGDEHLYFKHTFLLDDLELHPEWIPYVFNATRWFETGDGFAYKAE